MASENRLVRQNPQPLSLKSVREKTQPRILVVDDDIDIAEILAYNLRQQGYRVQVTDNAIEALRFFDEFAPDVLCIDYMMPEIDGMELARRIRARQDMLYVPIVMLTAVEDSDSTKLASLDSGVDAFLTKPFAREELVVTIRTMLRIKAAQDNMLDALDRVAQVQDELLSYERKQGHLEAMQEAISTYTRELGTPVKMAGSALGRVENLMQQAVSSPEDVKNLAAVGQAYLQQVREALTQIEQVLTRLRQTDRLNPRK